MLDSVLPFYAKNKKKRYKKFSFSKLNLKQFFSQRYGIGKKISEQIFLYSGFHNSTKYDSVKNKNYYVILRYKDFFVDKKLFLDTSLEEERKKNIKDLVALNNLKGKRHRSGLPVRGQRSKTNANTAYKLKLHF